MVTHTMPIRQNWSSTELINRQMFNVSEFSLIQIVCAVYECMDLYPFQSDEGDDLHKFVDQVAEHLCRLYTPVE